jgi:23S rRNA (guanosine2251-2'-O)-methyltransferase
MRMTLSFQSNRVTVMPMKSASNLSYIYGKHAAFEALTHRPDIVREVHAAETFANSALLQLIDAASVPIQLLNEKNPPRGISSNAPHQGVVLGITPDKLLVPYKSFVNHLEFQPHTALLVLGEVQDPHNVGAVIRSAAAFGLAGVLIPPHNQAPVTGTVVKVSAGMAFRIPLVSISNVNATLLDLKSRGAWVYGLDGNGTTTTHSESFERPSVFVLGNEGSGLRAKTREACDDTLPIPIHPRCESLNAAAATAVALAHWSARHNDALQ